MSMINIGLSGVMANQVALNTTAQNVANVNTAGYSRKTVDQSAVLAGSMVNGIDVGGGVQVSSIRRVTDQAAISRLRTAGEEMQYSQVFYEGMSNIENVLGMDGLNITNGLNDFFAAIDAASVTPESEVYRQQIITSGEALANRFNGISKELNNQLSGLTTQFNATVRDINSQLTSVADLNKQIQEASARGEDIAGLQDAMDVQLNSLSKSMAVNTVFHSDGTVELSTPMGQPLVINDTAASLSIGDSPDQYNMNLNLTFQNTTMPVDSSDLGGELGAIVDLKENQYEPLLENLNTIAADFANSVNDVLAGGRDLNGDLGVPLFEFDPDNAASSLTITDITADQLALSSEADEIGNGDNLQKLADLATGASGSISAYDAYAQVLGDVGIITRQAGNNMTTKATGYNEAQIARDNISAVNSDEEAANLMVYMNAYQANMKVISTANQMFEVMLNAF
ncbi:MAG: flagellar hook-associated protein FlgK [Vibrio sp.]